jgi:hypothetical protein
LCFETMRRNSQHRLSLRSGPRSQKRALFSSKDLENGGASDAARYASLSRSVNHPVPSLRGSGSRHSLCSRLECPNVEPRSVAQDDPMADIGKVTAGGASFEGPPENWSGTPGPSMGEPNCAGQHKGGGERPEYRDCADLPPGLRSPHIPRPREMRLPKACSR